MNGMRVGVGGEDNELLYCMHGQADDVRPFSEPRPLLSHSGQPEDQHDFKKVSTTAICQ